MTGPAGVTVSGCRGNAVVSAGHSARHRGLCDPAAWGPGPPCGLRGKNGGGAIEGLRSGTFLRSVGTAELITPLRSEGGHRRYSRRQLRIAARARELVDQGTPVEAACRIISLENQLDDALRLNREVRRKLNEQGTNI